MLLSKGSFQQEVAEPGQTVPETVDEVSFEIDWAFNARLVNNKSIKGRDFFISFIF